MKRPAFQFYPRDWQTDPELRSCSIAARGMWVDMLCIAHWAQPYGHLTINGKKMSDAQIVNAISGASTKLLAELEDAGVFSRTDDGAVYSRRMVRDESARNARAEGGGLGAQHGDKGGIHGAKGGRPQKGEGGLQTPVAAKPRGLKNPLKPPPASAFASASVLSTGVPVPTIEAGADRESRPDGDKSPENQNAAALLAKVPKGWHTTNDGIERAAQIYGVKTRPGEQHGELKRRVFDREGELKRQQHSQ